MSLALFYPWCFLHAMKIVAARVDVCSLRITRCSMFISTHCVQRAQDGDEVIGLNLKERELVMMHHIESALTMAKIPMYSSMFAS